ncbi:MAG: hypothetical protein ACRDG7_05425 [Candidatus Limnocylindria bacterium]
MAYVDRNRRAVHVRTAMDVGRRIGARLIFYALDDYTPLADPLPAAWSGDQEPGEFSDPLTADDLEMLGHPALAEQVAEAHGLGISAGGWLPREGGVDAMVDYAREHGAEVVLLPDDLPDRGLVDRLVGATEHEAAEQDRRELAVLLVDRQAPSGTPTRDRSPRARRAARCLRGARRSVLL